MKQTAVEWLAENIDNLIPFMNDNIAKKFSELVQQAKEIEKQQGYSVEEVDLLLNLLKQTTEYEVLQSFRDKVEKFKKK